MSGCGRNHLLLAFFKYAPNTSCRLRHYHDIYDDGPVTFLYVDVETLYR